MKTEVVSQILEVPYGGSKISQNHGMILSIRGWDRDSVNLIYGSPGSMNAQHKLQLGDAVLYETPTDGMVELRLMRQKTTDAEILVTKISPRLGFGVAIDPLDSENQMFAQDEILKIKDGIEAIKIDIAARTDVKPEQIELLIKRLDEIASASERLGKKDWIMFAVGNVTNFAIGAALAPAAAKALVNALNSNLGWVFQNAMRLIGAS